MGVFAGLLWGAFILKTNIGRPGGETSLSIVVIAFHLALSRTRGARVAGCRPPPVAGAALVLGESPEKCGGKKQPGAQENEVKEEKNGGQSRP